jgi:two-component system NtrC family sensor kinase
MAKTRKRAGKRARTAGRGGLCKPKSTKTEPHKQKPSLRSETARLKRQLKTARMQQEASAEILRAVANASGDAARPLQQIAETTARLFGAPSVSIAIAKGREFIQEYRVGSIAQRIGSAYPRSNIKVGGRNLPGTVVFENRQIHIPDLDHLDPSMSDFPGLPHARAGGARTVCGTPLRREGNAIGVLIIFRDRLLPFTEDELALQQSFADQAVIAIENARLFEQVQARTRDLTESLQQQTATSEVLQIISSSPGDLAPVFDKMLENATRVCGAEFGSMVLVEDDSVRQVALYNAPAALAVARANKVFHPHPQGQMAEAIRTRRAVHVADVRTSPAYLERIPYGIELVELGGARTVVVVPMLREDKVIGAITIFRQEVRPFADKQIELVSNFAKQAVIAIENARLLTETREALERQTATAEVLQVINSSPGDLTPVFDAMLEKAMRLCEATFGGLTSFDGERFHTLALRGLPPKLAEALREPWKAGPGTYHENLVQGESLVHTDTPNNDASRQAHPISFAVSEIGGARTQLFIALRKDGTLLGSLWFYRKEVRPFSDKQIALVQNFAAQAVVAMENARLLKELRQSLQQQTATADVLKVISRSSVDLETVLDTLVETVARLCHADQAFMFRRREDIYHLVAEHGVSQEAKEFFLVHPLAPDRGTISGRVELERRPVQTADVLQDPEYTYTGVLKITGARTMLGIPLLREDAMVGIFVVVRTHVEPFTTKEIELATTFADQAVIAIENARLIEELRDRQAELRVTFDNMGDGVVMFDADLRLVAWNRNFQEILDLPEAFLAQRPSFAEYFRYLADSGEYSADLEADLSRANQDPRRELRFERTRPDGRIIEVRRNPVPDGGFVLIYADVTERKRAEEAVRAARDAAESAVRELQAAQDRLVQTQKLASLGQLTAGIAHEIKNPLNFVNNFSALSVELTDELNDVLIHERLTDKGRQEVAELTGLLKDNLDKVVQHGKRADSIVKNMLLHSREGAGERRLVDVNALVEESLNLAYHGARAEKQGFTIALERSFDPAAGEVEAFPQEITRVLLNLISNGFYAAAKRQAREGGNGFEPTITAATKSLGDRVEIRIRDNGIGIPPEVREKMFNPFFTTKPAGEGTGLGLSISHDIIVKQHAGAIEVETEPGEFTELRIILPRIAT